MKIIQIRKKMIKLQTYNVKIKTMNQNFSKEE